MNWEKAAKADVVRERGGNRILTESDRARLKKLAAKKKSANKPATATTAGKSKPKRKGACKGGGPHLWSSWSDTDQGGEQRRCLNCNSKEKRKHPTAPAPATKSNTPRQRSAGGAPIRSSSKTRGRGSTVRPSPVAAIDWQVHRMVAADDGSGMLLCPCGWKGGAVSKTREANEELHRRVWATFTPKERRLRDRIAFDNRALPERRNTRVHAMPVENSPARPSEPQAALVLPDPSTFNEDERLLARVAVGWARNPGSMFESRLLEAHAGRLMSAEFPRTAISPWDLRLGDIYIQVKTSSPGKTFTLFKGDPDVDSICGVWVFIVKPSSASAHRTPTYFVLSSGQVKLLGGNDNQTPKSVAHSRLAKLHRPVSAAGLADAVRRAAGL